MEFTDCAQCGTEFEGKGIQFRGQVFCGDECCDKFEAEFVDKGEPDLDNLEDSDLDDVDDGLGFGDVEDPSLKDDDDDDFAFDANVF